MRIRKYQFVLWRLHHALQINVSACAKLVTVARVDRFQIWILAGYPRNQIGGGPTLAVLRRRTPGGDYEIAEWCALRRISVAMFYRLDAQGRAPDTVYTGRRRTIPQSADERWVRENSSSNDVATVAPASCAANQR